MKPDTNTPRRVVAKALTWETFSTFATFGLAWLMFGNLGTCVVFAAASYAMKLVLFYYHERVWSRVSWGKIYNRRFE